MPQSHKHYIENGQIKGYRCAKCHTFIPNVISEDDLITFLTPKDTINTLKEME
jgi:hypothetical protein